LIWLSYLLVADRFCGFRFERSRGRRAIFAWRSSGPSKQAPSANLQSLRWLPDMRTVAAEIRPTSV
jgi:hypothetical protein